MSEFSKFQHYDETKKQGFAVQIHVFWGYRWGTGSARNSVYSEELQRHISLTATGYQLLKPETIDLMRTEQLPNVAKNADFLCPAGPDYGYGLGVRTRVRMDGGENSGYGEFGWDGAAGCFELADPSNGVSIAFVTHVLGWPSIRNEFHIPIRNSVYEALKG